MENKQQEVYTKEQVQAMMAQYAAEVTKHVEAQKAQVSKQERDFMALGERLLDKAVGKAEKVAYNFMEDEKTINHTKKAIKSATIAMGINIVQGQMDLGIIGDSILDGVKTVTTISAMYNGYKAVESAFETDNVSDSDLDAFFAK